LKAYAVGSDNKPRFKRRPFPVTAEAAQSATARRDAVLSLFEGQSLGQIVSMVRNNNSDGSGGDQNYSAEDVRTHACKILANLAAIDEHNAVRVVQEGGLRAILSVFGGFNSLSNSEAVSLFSFISVQVRAIGMTSCFSLFTDSPRRGWGFGQPGDGGGEPGEFILISVYMGD
jgi:hypothetical protein